MTSNGLKKNQSFQIFFLELRTLHSRIFFKMKMGFITNEYNEYQRRTKIALYDCKMTFLPTCIINIILEYVLLTLDDHFNNIVATEKFEVVFRAPLYRFFCCAGLVIRLQNNRKPITHHSYGGSLALRISNTELRMMIQERQFKRYIIATLFLDLRENESEDVLIASYKDTRLSKNILYAQADFVFECCVKEYQRIASLIDLCGFVF
jgi:hypothetical protein